MATYNYTARDRGGNLVSGIIEAGEERGAASALRDQGLFPQRIVVASTGPVTTVASQDFSSFSAASPLAPPVGAQKKIDVAPFLVEVPLPELAMFYRQMGTLMNAGVPVVQALETMAQQSRNSRLQRILREAGQSVAGGNPLSRTMENHPNVFTGIQLEMIRAGETGGMMEKMCNRIADYIEREIEIRRKLKKETLYPKIVLFVAWLVGGLLLFLRAGATGGAAGYVKFTAFALVTAFAIWWGARYANQFPAVGAAWDRVKMLIPGPGGVSRKYATARFTRALSALYGGGVLLSNAVPSAARACGNRAIAQAMLAKAHLLHEGHGLSGMLAATGLLSPIAIQMAKTGEQTGSLDAMMDKVADYLEDEADAKSHQLAVATGVGALVLAALVVGYIAVSFYAGSFAQVFNEAGKE